MLSPLHDPYGWGEYVADLERQVEQLRLRNETMSEALDWYGEQAEAVARNLGGTDSSKWKFSAVEAILVALCIDGGSRAALSEPAEPEREG